MHTARLDSMRTSDDKLLDDGGWNAWAINKDVMHSSYTIDENLPR